MTEKKSMQKQHTSAYSCIRKYNYSVKNISKVLDKQIILC